MSGVQDQRTGTRARILEAAEALFAEHGFESVSLRDITREADANVASVNYHFGSKDKLIDAVVARHVMPINEKRLKLLEEAEGRHGGGAVPVEEILEAFLAPLLAQITSGEMSERLFCKFMGRLMGERGYKVPAAVEPLFRTMAGRFTSALRKSVPFLSEELALWRMHYSFGVMSNTLTHGETLRQLSAGRAGDPPVGVQFRRIIDFCASGFRAEAKEAANDE